jgi:hypothetical protein
MMRREAIVATIGLRDREGDAFACFGVQSLAQRAGQAGHAFQRGGALRDEAKKIGNDAKLTVDGFKNGSRGGGRGFNVGIVNLVIQLRRMAG